MTRRLTEVAAYAKVSEATVSRVLNGKPGVSDATRKAVLTALDVLGYERPTQLRGERARLVGLVLPELQNPIFPAFAEVVGGALAQQGFTPVLCTRTVGGASEADYLDLLLQHRVGRLELGSHLVELASKRAEFIAARGVDPLIERPRADLRCSDLDRLDRSGEIPGEKDTRRDRHQEEHDEECHRPPDRRLDGREGLA